MREEELSIARRVSLINTDYHGALERLWYIDKHKHATRCGSCSIFFISVKLLSLSG